jgi:hypothetical protein
MTSVATSDVSALVIDEDTACAILLHYLKPLLTLHDDISPYGAIVKLLEPESGGIAKLLKEAAKRKEHLDDIYPTLVAETAAELGLRCMFISMTMPPRDAQAAIAELVDGIKADLRDRIEINGGEI